MHAGAGGRQSAKLLAHNSHRMQQHLLVANYIVEHADEGAGLRAIVRVCVNTTERA